MTRSTRTQKNIFNRFDFRFKRFLIAVFFLPLLALSPTTSFARPFQVFIPKSDFPLLVDQVYSLDVFVLDKEGQIEAAFSGKRHIHVRLLKPDQKYLDDFLDLPRTVHFEKGKGLFTLKAKAEGTVVIDVKIEGVYLAGMLEIDFRFADMLPPAVENVEIQDVLNIAVFFDEVVEEVSAQKTQHYLLKTNEREIQPDAIEYHRTYVVLFFKEVFGLDENEGYLELEGIKDLSGNALGPGYKTATFQIDCGCVD
ncbi:MAG: Ig-like domain-containing protein [Candidatus Omnitrophica bacterium]|nr:Ig-like domain-containing protein [Candidatus Omnitrophota bacterium]